MDKNAKSGLGLVGILLIIGALLITAGGVVVWENKVSPAPLPTPKTTPTPEPTPTLSPGISAVTPFPSPVTTERVSVTCGADSDCFLTDERLFTEDDTCWPGACGDLDYSLDIIIAANRNSFQQFMQSYQERCGSPPSCPQKIVNTNFEAKCINSICQKVVERSETSEGCIGQARANWQCPRDKWLKNVINCCGWYDAPNLICCEE